MHAGVLSLLSAWRPHRHLWTTSKIYPTSVCPALPQCVNRTLDSQLTASFVHTAVCEGSLALCHVWKNIWRLRSFLEPCGNLPLMGLLCCRPPQGRIQLLLSLHSNQHRGTQDSPRASLALAIRQITTTLYNVFLQFNCKFSFTISGNSPRVWTLG